MMGRDGLGRFASIVTPETLLAWQHRLSARKYDGIQRRALGRPSSPAEVQDVILKESHGEQTGNDERYLGLAVVVSFSNSDAVTGGDGVLGYGQWEYEQRVGGWGNRKATSLSSNGIVSPNG